MTTVRDPNESDSPAWREIHERACKAHKLAYTDPQTGYRVFTAYGLAKRSRCCGSGCRHCPFGHARVNSRYRASLETEPYLVGMKPKERSVALLFWSGGKDSYLALLEYLSRSAREVVLVTVYGAETNEVSHQDVHVDVVKAQASALNLPLLLVPTYPGDGFREAAHRACSVVERWAAIKAVVFGDLNLDSVRRWRETVFAENYRSQQIETMFPLWGKPYDSLFQRLMDTQVVCTISAVSHESLHDRLQVGDVFDRSCFQSLASVVDAFGERGEFHTVIKPESLKPVSTPETTFWVQKRGLR